MNLTRCTRQFWREGYLHIPGFFGSGLMDKVNHICREHFGMDPEWEHTAEFIEKSNCEIVPWFPMKQGVVDFNEIEENPEFKTITAAILGEGWKSLYCMCMFSRQGTRGQAWHQDSPPEDPAKFNLNRLVYTHHITEELGGEVVIKPQTHNSGPISKGDPQENMEGQVVLRPKKGDVVFLHGHCWHRVLEIKGPYRISTNFRATPSGTPGEITDVAVYRNMRYYFPANKVIEER